MKNRMQDVRNHLVAMMESLADAEATPEVIERAKATAALAQTYTNTVKVELEARKLAGCEHELPEALQPPKLTAPKLVHGGRA